MNGVYRPISQGKLGVTEGLGIAAAAGAALGAAALGARFKQRTHEETRT
jgi:hypothetical protein